jgi:O-antigen/teichoic acid export membrane protein
MRRGQVRISFVAAMERVPFAGLRKALAPAGVALDSVLHDKDDRSVSRRITIFTFLVRVLSAAIAYVSQVLLARWMGDFQYGVFVVVWVGAVILGGLACLGFNTAILRFVPEYLERGEVHLLRGVVIGSRLQGLIASTFFAAVGALGLHFFGDKLSSYYLIPLYLGAITLPMLAIGEIQDGLSRSFNWADLALWPAYIIRPLLILLFMGAAIWMGFGATAVTAMWSVIAATYLTSLVQLFTLERRIRRAVPAGPRKYQPLLWVGVSLPIFVVEGFFNLLTNVDIILVGHYMDPDQVGIYFAAAKTMALVHFIYYAVRAGSAQRFSQYYTNGDRGRLAAFVRDTLHWTFWPSVAMVGLLLIAGKLLLALVGATFVAGYPILFVLSIGLLFRASIGPAETLLIMAGQQGISAAVYTATFFLNVALNMFLIPRYGLLGAAAATSSALAAESLALYVIAYTRLGIRCSILDAVRPIRAAVKAS